VAGSITLFNVTCKTEGIHPVAALINLFRHNKIATLEEAPVATPDHASRLHFRLRNMNGKGAKGDKGAQINSDRTKIWILRVWWMGLGDKGAQINSDRTSPVLDANFGVGSAAIDVVASRNAAQV